jgi:hypothetical protein
MNHDQWSSQNDPMTSSAYGLPFLLAAPLVAAVVGGGVAAGGALRRYAERTNVNDIAREAANEQKRTTSLPNSRAEVVPNMMFQGAADTKEAGFIAAFWLHRAGRVALGQGRRQTADRLFADSRAAYSAAARTVFASDDQGEIASILRRAKSQVASTDTAMVTTLDTLSRASSTRNRQQLKAETGPGTTLVQPGRQTAQDLKETGEDLGAGAGWFMRNAVWLVPVVGVSYLAIVLLAARQAPPERSGRRRRA